MPFDVLYLIIFVAGFALFLFYLLLWWCIKNLILFFFCKIKERRNTDNTQEESSKKSTFDTKIVLAKSPLEINVPNKVAHIIPIEEKIKLETY